jgi:hypothetical protein
MSTLLPPLIELRGRTSGHDYLFSRDKVVYNISVNPQEQNEINEEDK